MNAVARGLFAIVGVINLLPVSGVLSTTRLEALYGVALTDPNLIILMRHRAILFGIIGALLLAAAFRASLRYIAATAGLVSMISFVLIAYLVGEFNSELRRIVIIDIVASILLVGAVLITMRSASGQATTEPNRQADTSFGTRKN